jgi:urea transport system permease protein
MLRTRTAARLPLQFALSPLLWAALVAVPATEARADTVQELAAKLGSADHKVMHDAIVALGAHDDEAALVILQALEQDRLRVSEREALIKIDAGTFRDPFGERTLPSADGFAQPLVTNAVRRALKTAIARASLRSDDPKVRLSAAETVANAPTAEMATAIRAALERETDARVRRRLTLALAQLDLESPDPKLRLAAVTALAEVADPALKRQLQAMIQRGSDGKYSEPDAAVRAAAGGAVAAIERQEFFVRIARDLFYGLSLGSVLLLAALGLAITFGLMGVINMAHGEMLMLGAYATYVVQRLFQTHAPGGLDYYLAASLPVAFAVCFLVGVLLERSVIRFLYGRPLETLLATWGISLMMIQAVRLSFGAANVTVANPTWLSGGHELMSGVVLPYARIATVGFAVLVVACLWYVLNRTTLGLQVRAITQNRRMARCVGIRTARVDTLTFGIGSGVAGLGGVALSQLGNVGPELGQGYIVDSFMVVVVGGVGSLFGTIFAALGLGTVNKLLEPVSGAVLGKILVLAFIILFIQRRPQGLFALKGRAAES